MSTDQKSDGFHALGDQQATSGLRCVRRRPIPAAFAMRDGGMGRWFLILAIVVHAVLAPLGPAPAMSARVDHQPMVGLEKHHCPMATDAEARADLQMGFDCLVKCGLAVGWATADLPLTAPLARPQSALVVLGRGWQPSQPSPPPRFPWS